MTTPINIWWEELRSVWIRMWTTFRFPIAFISSNNDHTNSRCKSCLSYKYDTLRPNSSWANLRTYVLSKPKTFHSVDKLCLNLIDIRVHWIPNWKVKVIWWIGMMKDIGCCKERTGFYSQDWKGCSILIVYERFRRLSQKSCGSIYNSSIMSCRTCPLLARLQR